VMWRPQQRYALGDQFYEFKDQAGSVFQIRS
jgi:hypothetical protein